MFKLMFFKVLVLLGSMNVYANTAELSNVVCSNDKASFGIVNVGNPRNHSDAMLIDVKGDIYFGGVWLKLVENMNGGILIKTKYKTQSQGIIEVVTTQHSKYKYWDAQDQNNGGIYHYVKIKAYYTSENSTEEFKCKEI